MESVKLEKEFTVFVCEIDVSAVHAWHWKMLIENSKFFSLLLFDPISSHGLAIRGFAITLIVFTTLDRTHQNEWSGRRRDLYMTTHNIHNKFPCPRWDSNSLSQQACGRRPIPSTERPLGSGKISNSFTLEFILVTLTHIISSEVSSVWYLCNKNQNNAHNIIWS